MIQTKNSFINADYLITGTAVTSVLFIVATLGRLNVAMGKVEKGSPFSTGASYFGVAGIYGLLIIMIFVVSEITLIGGIVLGIIIVISLVIFQKLKTKIK